MRIGHADLKEQTRAPGQNSPTPIISFPLCHDSTVPRIRGRTPAATTATAPVAQCLDVGLVHAADGRERRRGVGEIVMSHGLLDRRGRLRLVPVRVRVHGMSGWLLTNANDEGRGSGCHPSASLSPLPSTRLHLSLHSSQPTHPITPHIALTSSGSRCTVHTPAHSMRR